MSRKDLERVRALLSRAAHEGTPEEEARSSALIAARMMARLGFVIVENEPYIPLNIKNANHSYDSSGPIDWDSVEPLKLFRIERAKGPAYCFNCRREIKSPELICKEIDGSRITCTASRCKESWSGL